MRYDAVEALHAHGLGARQAEGIVLVFHSCCPGRWPALPAALALGCQLRKRVLGVQHGMGWLCGDRRSVARPKRLCKMRRSGFPVTGTRTAGAPSCAARPPLCSMRASRLFLGSREGQLRTSSKDWKQKPALREQMPVVLPPCCCCRPAGQACRRSSGADPYDEHGLPRPGGLPSAAPLSLRNRQCVGDL